AVDVAGDAGDEVVARDAHQVVADVRHVVVDRVLAVREAHVLVDGGEAHGDGAGPVHRRLVDHGDLEVVRLRPVCGLDCGAAGGHATAEDEEVGLDRHGIEVLHWRSPYFVQTWGRRGAARSVH